MRPRSCAYDHELIPQLFVLAYHAGLHVDEQRIVALKRVQQRRSAAEADPS